MKQKINKKVACVMAAALCAGIMIPAATLFFLRAEEPGGAASGLKGNYGGTFTAFAAEASGATAANASYTMTSVRGMYSTDRQYLLLATGVTVNADVQDNDSGLYEVGYKVTKGGEEVELPDLSEWQSLYTGITFSAGEENEETQGIADVLGEDAVSVTGMIVYELEYDMAEEYTVQPYVMTDAETTQSGTAVTVPAWTATVSVQTPEGIVPGYESKEFVYGDTLELPTVSGTAEGYGSAVQGWYDVATGNLVTSETVLQGDMTIAPYFNVGKDGITQLKFGTFGDNSNVVVDNPTPANWDDNITVETDVYDGYVKGTTVTGSGNTSVSSFRVKTNYQWDNHTVNYADVYYVVTNNGEETVSFDLKMIPGGGTVSQATGSVSVDDLAPGETRAVKIENFNQTNKNASNLLTYIQFDGEGVTAFDLHVGIAVEKIS